MLVQQYIKEFNNETSNIKFLSYKDEIVLSNKLKLISNHFGDVTANDVNEFFSNVYHLLCQTSDMKSGLMEECLDVVLVALKSRNTKIHHALLQDFRFLPIVVNNIVNLHEDDDVKLVKLLTVTRDLLSYSSEFDEHNLKLIIEVLRDHVENSNKDVKTLCLDILTSLCLDNYAAKYLITRTMKTTELRRKASELSNALISFKLFILLEDEIHSKDLKYFLAMSLTDVRAGIATLDVDPIKHSLDIMRHVQNLQIKLDIKVNGQEAIQQLLKDLCEDLIEILTSVEDSPCKESFFDGIFKFLKMLLEADGELATAMEPFVESAFLSSVSKSASALKMLSTFIKCGGSLGASELIVENLFEFFIGNSETQHQAIDYDQKFAFLTLLDALFADGKPSDEHIEMVANHFESLIETFKSANLSEIDDEEVFLFIHFLHALSCLARKNSNFYGKLENTLQLDFLPMLAAKGHLSRKEEVLMILFDLSSVSGFPNQKIAAILSRSGTRADASATQSLYNSIHRRDVQSKTSRFLSRTLSEEVDRVIRIIDSNMDSNEMAKNSNVIQLYRQKINMLNDHLSSVTQSLDRSTLEIADYKHKIVQHANVTEKQEFHNWCLHLDNERLIAEFQCLSKANACLKTSVKDFQSRITKDEAKKVECQKKLNLKDKEIEQIKTSKAQLEQKLQEAKSKLLVMQKENETRIEELKTSLEAEQKSKGEELKKLRLKIITAEKENQNLQELVKIHEKELVQKQEKLQQVENELKEGEQMKSMILSLMQSKNKSK